MESESMKVSFLNAPTLAVKIPQLIQSCDQMDLCIAFIKIKGLNKLLFSAEKLIKKGGKVRIVFGSSRRLGITDKESVRELLEFSNRTGAKIRHFNHPAFHPKMYMFHGGEPSFIIGSSNLTNAALAKNVEANILVENPDEALFENVNRFFDECFKMAQPLTNEDVRQFNPIKQRPFNPGPNGKPEDDLPPQQVFDGYKQYVTIEDLLNQKQKKRFYIMHLSYGDDGYRDECWAYATENDLIGLSYNKVVNDDWIKIRSKACVKIKRVRKYIWIRQFDLFCEGISEESMEIGDLVFVFWGQSHLMGIAEVMSDHIYDKKYSKGFFDHVRSVSWITDIDYQQKIRVPSLLGFDNTLSLVKENQKRWKKLLKVKI
jgi:HKD family nuclease